MWRVGDSWEPQIFNQLSIIEQMLKLYCIRTCALKAISVVVFTFRATWRRKWNRYIDEVDLKIFFDLSGRQMRCTKVWSSAFSLRSNQWRRQSHYHPPFIIQVIPITNKSLSRRPNVMSLFILTGISYTVKFEFHLL